MQLWCLNVDTLYIFNVELHITLHLNEKYKLMCTEWPSLEAKIFLTLSVVKCCLTTSQTENMTADLAERDLTIFKKDSFYFNLGGMDCLQIREERE